ncbi:Na+/H+ antiporter [Hymenobacter nivis]|uniref:Na+/H+ antiporter n=1 Tax=Hymenobacter nivis TaxID=1850093 RepID=A0A502GYU1_9BACT|nr:Na+/H+ antiporter [Hymenobacter nivis]TPG66602.1 Na+/H+ antiporter [Hymenobacter nivis]
MNSFETILVLLALLAALSVLFQRSRLPQAVLLVAAGLALGFVPGLPPIKLEPDVVFLLILPPLLYYAGFNLTWQDFNHYRRPILLLAVGLVAFTTVAVAVVAHYFLPGFGWPLAFVLGAIVSPPDAVAASSATQGLGLPKSVSVTLEGEGLVNDATALIAYRYAVAAVVSGGFVAWRAGGQFVLVAGGGVALGVAAGYLTARLQAHVREATTATVISLLLPFLVYLLAEHVGASGVLAVVFMGLVMSRRAPEVYSGPTRLQNASFWRVVNFLLNGFVFILIGLQLPAVLRGLPAGHLPALCGYGLLISAVAIGIRIVWIFPVTALVSFFRRSTGHPASPLIGWRELLVTSWAGMRGVVSLATALALPLVLADGRAFPQRNVLLFLTFAVILVTLLVQGLTLPWLVRRLGVHGETAAADRHEQALRLELATDSLAFLHDTLATCTAPEVLAPLEQRLTQQIDLLQANATDAAAPDAAGPGPGQRRHQQVLRTNLAVVQHQLGLLVQRHKQGHAEVEIIRKLQRELDLAELDLQTQLEESGAAGS